jgi:type I restriction enzyme M protein
LLVNALNEKGDSIPKANLNKRIKELESKKTSPVMSDITKLIELLDEAIQLKWSKSFKITVS